MSQYARCDRCHHSGGDHAEGCGEPDEAPLSPIALDFEAAHIAAFGSASGFYLSKHKAKCREHLNAQVRALVARVAQGEREKARRETLIEAAAGIRKEIVAFQETFPELKDGPQSWGKELACRYLERMMEVSP